VKFVLRADAPASGRKGDMIDVADGFGQLPGAKGPPSRRHRAACQQAASMRRARDLLTPRTATPRPRSPLVSSTIITVKRSRHRRAAVRVGHGADVVGPSWSRRYRARPPQLRLDEPIKVRRPHQVPVRLHTESSSRSPSTSSRSTTPVPPRSAATRTRGVRYRTCVRRLWATEAPSTGISQRCSPRKPQASRVR